MCLQRPSKKSLEDSQKEAKYLGVKNEKLTKSVRSLEALECPVDEYGDPSILKDRLMVVENNEQL
jgi:hypothetical protein